MDLGLEAIGTNAHELPMVYAALANSDDELAQAPYVVLDDWAKLYQGNLLVLLPTHSARRIFSTPRPIGSRTGPARGRIRSRQSKPPSN